MVRADARENRARILAAARVAFAEDDGASMNQIAQRAGVGPGTLYRNYPSREALILDIYQDEVAKLPLCSSPSPLSRAWPPSVCRTAEAPHASLPLPVPPAGGTDTELFRHGRFYLTE